MTLSAKNPATVAIVLCTHNGAHWIEEQLLSLFQQSHPVAVRVFDDASSDDTIARVKALGAGRDLQCIEHTKALGVVQNFATGIQSVLDEGFEYIALADQDDIWTVDRIAVGMKVLLAAENAQNTQNSEADTSASLNASASASASASANVSPKAQLVHSDLSMVNAQNQAIHSSFMQWRRYRTKATDTLSLVLGQNGVMGNTVLMNRALAQQALPFPEQLHVHDYWLAVVADLLGERHYIDQPLVRYRIHNKNVSNSSTSVSFGLRRMIKDWSFDRFVRRDFYLPYKEDSRLKAVECLLTDPRFKAINTDQRATIHAFLRYLHFAESRISIAAMMWRSGFLRSGFAHRLRVFVNIMTT